jgi:hypothetical protein
LVAALHDEVRVCAIERQAAGEPLVPIVAVVVGAFFRVVERSGADDGIRVFHSDLVDGEIFEQRPVAVGANAVDVQRRALDQQAACEVAGGDEVIVSIGRDGEACELFADRTVRARRVREQQHGALFAIAAQRVDDAGERFAPVVNDAPDVADDNVIARGEFVQA